MQACCVSYYRVEVQLLIKHFMCLMHHVFVQRLKQQQQKRYIFFIAVRQEFIVSSAYTVCKVSNTKWMRDIMK